MSDFTPSAAALPVQPITPASAQIDDGGLSLQGQAGIVQLPDKLQDLTRSVILGAQVSTQNPDGTVTLKTAAGDVTIKPTVPLPPGTQSVTIQIQPGAPPTAGAIYTNNIVATVNVMPPTSLANTLAVTLASSVAGSATASVSVQSQTISASSGNVLPVLAPGAVVAATLVQGSAQNNPQTNDQAYHQKGQSGQQFQQGNSGSSNTFDLQSNLNNTPQNTKSAAMANALNLQNTLQSQISGNGLISNAPINTANLSPQLLESVQQTVSLLNEQTGGNSMPQSVTGSNISGAPTAGLLAQNLERLPVGSQLSVQIVQIGQTIAPAQNNLPGGAAQLQGQVLSVITQDNAQAQVIVQTDIGQIALQTSIIGGKPAIGTNLLLQIVPQNTAAGVVPQNNVQPLNKQGKDWPALDALMQSLAAQNSSAVPHLMNAIPKMNGDLPVAALFFLTALRSGDVKHWLGERGLGSDAEDALDKADMPSVKDLIAKDFASLKDLKATSPQGEWKLYQMPLMTDQGLNRLQLAVRDHYEKSEDDEMIDGKGTRVTRFVVDVDYSGYGQVQLDGFMREKKLDVVVRAQNAFPDDMRREILGVYNNVLENQGMNGTLSFQAGYANWIKLMQDGSHSSYSA